MKLGRNRRDWTERLDELFRALVMIRFGAARMPLASGDGWFWYGRCCRCGKLTALYVSHIEPKGEYPHLRWADGNAFAFCYRCHIHWWHKNPRAANDFALMKLGVHKRETLAVLARHHAGSYRPDFNALEVEMVLKLKRLAPGGIEGIQL